MPHSPPPVLDHFEPQQVLSYAVPGAVHRVAVFIPETDVLLLGVTDAVSPFTALLAVGVWGRQVVGESVAGEVRFWHLPPGGADNEEDGPPILRWPLAVIADAFFPVSASQT